MKTPRTALFAASYCEQLSAGPGEYWSRFRGPNGAGIAETVGVPAEIGPQQNVLWKVECGPGFSSPIVFEKRLFYTSFRGDERLVHCLDAYARGGRAR